MRKILCLISAILVCFTLVCPVFATSDTFVPSIGYKDGPEIEDANMNNEDVGDCLVVTSIMQAEKKSTDIYQEDRDLLLDVYQQLDEGTMELPIEDEYVIRELVDVSFRKTTCVEKEHGHKEWLAEDNTTLEVTFDLGVKANTKVIVLVYINGEWIPVESVNNGDGTVTCVFDDICPVAFCVRADAEEAPPKTGDEAGGQLLLWILLMVASLAAIVVLLVRNRKHAR